MITKINEQLTAATKNRDVVTMNTLRSIKAKITEAQKASANKELSDAEILQLIQKLIKQRQDSIIEYEKAARLELVTQETFELKILQSFLPTQMTRDEILTEISTIVNDGSFSTMKDMGKVMSAFNAKYLGKADNKTVSEVVKAMLVK